MKVFSSFLFSIVIISAFVGCKKDSSILGVGVQPTSDMLNASFSDTSSVNCYTQKCDSTASINSDAYKFLGSNQDPYFGRTDVGLFVNMNLNASNVSFRNAIFDSSSITIRVIPDGSLGNQKSIMSFSVFAIESVISNTVAYYTNNPFLHNPAATPIGIYTGNFSQIGAEVILRIPIDPTFALSIFNDTASLVGNDVFQNNYKGFYISSSGSNLNPFSNPGIVARCDLDHDLTGFNIYYKKADTSKITSSFKLGFTGSTAVRFNKVTYQPNEGGSYLLTKQLEGDTALGSEALFLKGLGLTKIKINIPYLRNYADSFKVAVNRAEVVFNVDRSLLLSASNYSPLPSRLALIPISTKGLDTIPYDYLTTADYGRYDGYYDSDNNRYVFNIARHVQAIFNGEVKNNGFILVVSNLDYPSPIVYYTNGIKQISFRRDNFAGRVILAGANNEVLKPKLNLSFIKYKKD